MTATDLQNCFARACYDFPGTEGGDLSFTLGEVLYISKQIDRNWCSGHSLTTGRSGIFPTNFVTKLNLPKLQTSSQKLFLARDRFIGQESGDLNFLEGDLIVGVRALDANWWEGEAGGRKGIFPLTFAVELTAPTAAPTTASTSSSKDTFSTSKSEIRAKVKHDLHPVDEQELELRAGDVVIIEEYIDKFTCRGRTLDNKRGLFGRAFVELLDGKPPPGKSIENSQHKIHNLPNKISSPPTSLPSNFVLHSQESVAPYGRTKYKFEAEYSGELHFPAGQIIRLIRHVDDEWTEGLLDGRRGIFPTSYVDIVVDCPRMQFSPPPTLKNSIVDSGYTSSGSDSGGNVKRKPTSNGGHTAVLFDFMGEEQGDLTAFKGDPVVIIRPINDDWVEAKHSITGQIGVIPLRFVQTPENKSISNQDEVTWRPKPAVAAHLNDSIARNLQTLDLDGRISPKNLSPRIFAAPEPPRQSMPKDYFKNITMPQVKQTQQTTPPPRPAAPVALKARQTASEHLEIQRQQAKEQKKQEMRKHRTKVIQEIMCTEKDYEKELTIFRETVLNKKNMLDADTLLGNGVWSLIIELCQQLTAKLEEQFSKDFVYQEIGAAFLALADDFKRVYGSFCESHEKSQMLLDKYETEPDKQVVLKDLLTKLQQRTTCIDLSTMLSRPVQRVLKYPLFLGELLKCTEDNQSDKVKLLMAVKVMTEVAQAINESKRRKDLVTKYCKDGDVKLTDRLSRLTFHSVRKKSSRLSMRLSSSIGLTQIAKDDQFEDAERQFRAVDRCCRNFLRDAQAYCEQLVAVYNFHISIADALNYGVYGNSIAADGQQKRKISANETSTSPRQRQNVRQTSAFLLPSHYLEAWSKILLSDSSVLQKFFDAVNEKVRQPLAHVQHSCKGPEKLIAKRGDKLLDYESATAKLDGTGGARAAEPIKFALAEEDVRKAKVEYEAMNTQLLNELPQFNRLAGEIILMAVRAFVAAQRNFIYELSRCFEQTIVERDDGHRLSFTVNAEITAVLEKFNRQNRPCLNDLANLCFFTSPSTGLQTSGTSRASVKRQTSITSEISMKKAEVNRSTFVFPQKLQTDVDRNVLRQKYSENQLYVAVASHEANGDLELTLKTGDLIGVIVDKDPMGCNDRWFVDNGISKGFAPRHVLKSAVPQPSSDVIQRPPKPKISAPLIDINDTAEKQKRPIPPQQSKPPIRPDAASSKPSPAMPRGNSPVIFLQEKPREKLANVSNGATKFQRRTTIDRGDGPSRPAAPIPRPASVVGNETSASQPIYACVQKAQRPAPAPPAQNSKTIQPIRAAPAPPPPSASSTVRASPPTVDEEEKKRDQESTTDNDESVEFFVALYDFLANSENEISMCEGQVFAVHAKQDLESNPEWWLIEDEDGVLGYAPGNYLSPYTKK